MTDQQTYAVQSLELHIFFARIMKEHAIFLEAGFTPTGAGYSKIANRYKEHFESVLHNAVMLGNGVIGPTVMSSGELVTPYTLESEQKTEYFTGILIDQSTTEMALNLHGNTNPQITNDLEQQISTLNSEVGILLDEFIEFKTQVADEVLACRMFTAHYPTFLQHILHEAQMYKASLDAIEGNQDQTTFWDHIMLEHAVFIRGLLDPSENNLIDTANNFATEYSKLLQTSDANESLQ